MSELLESRGSKPRRGSVVKCEECGKEVYARPSEQKTKRFCSKACHSASMKRQAEQVCVGCGVTFTQAQSVQHKYCSWACYSKHRMPNKPCLVCGTILQVSAQDYCSPACWAKAQQSGTERPCAVCGTPVYVKPYQEGVKKYCSVACHSESMRLDGAGGRYKTRDGYIQVYYPKHPDAGKNGMIFEHRLVAEQKYGRRLLRSEHIHHINGIRDENTPENIELIAPGDHAHVSIAAGVEKRRSMREELEEYRKRYGPL